MKSLMLILLLASVALTGCIILQEEVEVEENVTEPPPPPPPPTPSFSITSPESGEVVLVSEETGEVSLVMKTENLLLRPVGGLKKFGEGHFKITLDGSDAGTSSSKIAVLEDVTLGTHTIEVELMHNDGTSYSPRITASVTFTMEQEEPEEYVPQEYQVKIYDFEYDPSQLTVKQTDKVTFTNEGNYPRSATCFIHGEEIFDTDVLAPGKSATITMDQIMECEFYSTTHYAMKGRIKVESSEG